MIPLELKNFDDLTHISQDVWHIQTIDNVNLYLIHDMSKRGGGIISYPLDSINAVKITKLLSERACLFAKVQVLLKKSDFVQFMEN